MTHHIPPSMSSTSLRNSRVVIVGAGLAGYTAAAALAQIGVRQITLIDALKDPATPESHRSYSLVLDKKGQQLLSMLDGFEHIFAREAFCQHVRVVSERASDGSESVSSHVPKDGPLFWIMKYRLLQLLHEYVITRYPFIKCRFGCALRDIVVSEKDATKSARTALLVEEEDGGITRIEADVILACDGYRSTVVKLAGKMGDEIESAHGMSLYSNKIASTGIRHKGIVMEGRPLISDSAAILPEYAEPSVMYKLLGKRKGRESAAFDMLLLPVSSGTHVGRRGVVGLRESHPLLSVKNGEEMMQLLQDNFPQLSVQDMFSPDAVSQFATTQANEFPPVQRPRSLVAFIRAHTSFETAIIVLGDAAHSFPPDCAQGSNAALQDVQTLLQIVMKSSDDVSARKVLCAYEAERDHHIWALVHLAGKAASQQYGQRSLRSLRFTLNRIARGLIVRVLPVLGAPDADTLLRSNMSYGDAQRRDRICSLTLAFLGVAATTAVAITARRH